MTLILGPCQSIIMSTLYVPPCPWNRGARDRPPGGGELRRNPRI